MHVLDTSKTQLYGNNAPVSSQMCECACGGRGIELTVRINVRSIRFLVTASSSSSEVSPLPTANPSINSLFHSSSGAMYVCATRSVHLCIIYQNKHENNKGQLNQQLSKST